MGELLTNMGLNQEEQRGVEKTIGKIKSVTDFASDLIDAVENTALVEAIKKISPFWAGPLAEATGEAVPPIKFVVKLLEKLPEKASPERLGLLACTLAYQRSAEEALQTVGPPKNRVPLSDSAAEAKAALKKSKFTDPELLKESHSATRWLIHSYGMRIPPFKL